jgi:SAM-dependent methyltransferase
MRRLDDPALVAREYASEDRLRARQRLYRDVSGENAPEVLWRVLAELRPRTVLEVGGGPGELAERMRVELGASVSFIDISPRMVELARARGVDALVGDVQKLPFADASFDTAGAAWMLYHVPDLDRGLAELARVLQPGGSLVAVTNSIHHLRELRDLVRYPAGQESFNRENGERYLRRHFSAVERIDADITITVNERALLVDYRQSMLMPTEPVPDDVPLPFIVHGRTSVFVARR